MQLPDFLKRENRPPIDPVSEEFGQVLKEYEKIFGDRVPNEPSCLSLEEWTELMRICIKEGKSYEELTGDVLEEDALI